MFLGKMTWVTKVVRTKENVTCVAMESKSRETQIWVQDHESWDKKGRGFVFENEDKDGRGAKNSGVFSRGVASRSGDNFVPLTCQYQVIIESIIIQAFLNGFC